jgi:hypothetical protein
LTGSFDKRQRCGINFVPILPVRLGTVTAQFGCQILATDVLSLASMLIFQD